MPILIDCPKRIPVPGGKRIDEYVGAVNSGTTAASVAIMHSPAGWSEPGQRPDFDEFTSVLKGPLHVGFEGGAMDAGAGQAVIAAKGEWGRYSTPDGAEYVAVCVPAFILQCAHRDADAWLPKKP